MRGKGTQNGDKILSLLRVPLYRKEVNLFKDTSILKKSFPPYSLGLIVYGTQVGKDFRKFLSFFAH